MATFELYRWSIIGMCLIETLNEMVSSGTLSPELAIQVLAQLDKVLCCGINNFFLRLWLCSPDGRMDGLVL
jgi:transcription initiation factor TFIIA small subunit